MIQNNKQSASKMNPDDDFKFFFIRTRRSILGSDLQTTKLRERAKKT